MCVCPCVCAYMFVCVHECLCVLIDTCIYTSVQKYNDSYT